MKKLLSLILALSLLLSFTGCSYFAPGEFDHIVELLEQGEYEEAKEAIDALQGYVPTEPAVVETEPVEAPVEEEIPAEPAPEAEIKPAPVGESKKVLVALSTTEIDNLGNESVNNDYFYDYDERGRIVKIGGNEAAVPYGVYLFTFADYLKLTYAPDGSIEKVMVTDSWDDVSALGTPTYDENGNMISMHIQTNTEEFTLNFAYDANGNRIRADIFSSFWEDIAFDIQYTYSAEGYLIREDWNFVGFGNTGRTIEHTYDEKGLLIQSYRTWHEYEPWHETTIYTYDEDGDMIQAVTTSDKKESGYKTKTTDFEYAYVNVAP